jgi:hypothetical protein
MSLVRSQRGMTIIGWIFTLIFIGLGVLFVLRLVPLYIESFKIDSALESIMREDGVLEMSRAEVTRKFVARMSIEDVDRFDTEEKVKKHLTVEKGDGRLVVRLVYDAETPLVGNLSLRAHWEKEVRRP